MFDPYIVSCSNIAPDRAFFFFFQQKSVVFLFLHENLCCGCWQDAFNEYPQHIYLLSSKNNILRKNICNGYALEAPC